MPLYPPEIHIQPDGNYIIAGSGDRKVYLFDKEGELLWSHETGLLTPIDVAVSTNGDYIIAGPGILIPADPCINKTYLFNKEGKLLRSYNVDFFVYDVAVSGDENYVVAGGDKTYLFDSEGELLWSNKTASVYDVAVSVDGSYIAAGSGTGSINRSESGDNIIYLFNKEGKLVWSYKTGGTVFGVAVSTDGSYVVAGSQDNKVYFFANRASIENQTPVTLAQTPTSTPTSALPGFEAVFAIAGLLAVTYFLGRRK